MVVSLYVKWNCSNPAVLELIPDELKDTQSLCTLPDDGGYTKTLGMECGDGPFPSQDPRIDNVTKVAKTFDILEKVFSVYHQDENSLPATI